MDEAPPEMAKHPVMLIEKYCNKVIAERRAKVSQNLAVISNNLNHTSK